ncbi:MAG: hypothetical protein EOM26_03995 [Alphaproteobacteria bacterium]|nr:hypothetical protein [Alphaproteobacteria bacterium]
MKGAFRILMLTGATATLAACACPVTGEYNQTPYGDRIDASTAGSGVAIYEGRCETAEPMLDEKPLVRERRQPVQEAEPIFRERVRK